MQKINSYKRKMQLSKLALLASSEKRRKVGFLKGKGEIRVPDNFNDLYSKTIEDLFNGE